MNTATISAYTAETAAARDLDPFRAEADGLFYQAHYTAPDGRELTNRWDEAQRMRDIVRGLWSEVSGAPQ